jgi:hypothetical protein
MKLKEFIANANVSESLIKAVVKQFGGWEAFLENVEDVANHGIDGGYSGFIYYSDTVPFAQKPAVREAILEQLGEDAHMSGTDVLDMVSNFRAFDATCEESLRDLYRYLSETKCKGADVPNLMAWYAAEVVCGEFVALQENLNTL